MRDRTITLLDDCLDTFELYRLVAATSDDRTHRRRALGSPDELRKALALDSDEYAAYHAAVLTLRAWCEQDPDSAAGEMVALTIEQVEQRPALRRRQAHPDRPEPVAGRKRREGPRGDLAVHRP